MIAKNELRRAIEVFFGLADAGEADFAAQDDHGFEERRGVLAAADGYADGLEHGAGFQA
jgi:hypothetical protein